MSDALAHGLVRSDSKQRRVSLSYQWLAVVAASLWLVSAYLTYALPDTGDFDRTFLFANCSPARVA